MKKLFIAILVSFPVLGIGQTDTENYVKTTAYQVPTQDGNVGVNNKQESITYYDGLGRPKQQIAINSAISASQNTDNSLLDWSGSWEEGTGTVGPFSATGHVSENNRLIDDSPFGSDEVVWRCGADVDPHAVNDGGYNTSFFNVDKTLSYRFRVWIRKSGDLADGRSYHGTANVNNLNGTAKSNPYFWSGDLPQLDEWYLMVGVVHPHGYTGGDTGVSGVYDVSGNKVSDGNEYTWRSRTVNSRLRNFLVYANNSITRQDLWNPVVELLDGSAPPIADIVNGGSTDIITHVEYDGLGRQTKQYLPYASGYSGGEFNPTAQSETLDFYDTEKYENTLNPYSETAFEPSPLNRPLAQAAPGNIWSMDQIGDDNHTIKFQYDTNTITTIEDDGTVIDGDDVLNFEVIFQGNNTAQPLLVYEGLYEPQQLYKNSTRDENWKEGDGSNHSTEEFTNKSGQVILKRTYANEIPHDTYYVYDDFGNLTFVLSPKATDEIIAEEGPFTDFTIQKNYKTPSGILGTSALSYDSQTNEISLNFDLTMSPVQGIPNGAYGSDTGLPDMHIGTFSATGGTYSADIIDGILYIAGSGTFSTLDNTISNTVPTAALNPEALSSLSYEYHYDYRNRLIEKKIPGKAWEYIIYDKLDRPILTQSGNLRENNQWLFTKYDAFGRVTYTGLYQDSNTCTGNNCERIALQSLADSHTVLEESKISAQSLDNTTVYYTNDAFPTSLSEIHTINYYDDYSFDWNYNNGLTENPASYSNPYNMTLASALGVNGTKTLPTGSKVRVLGTDDWIVSMTLYDNKARPIYAASYNEYLDTIDESHNNIDFIGNALESTMTHTKNGTSITTVDYFEYDRLNRLKWHKQEINGGTRELIAQNHYDALGQLTRKDVGGATTPNQDHSTSYGLQKIDYTYNIRGWLKEINNIEDASQSIAADPDDLFNFKINYATPEIGANQDIVGLYNGNISETLWRTLNEDSNTKGYGYEYDALNRLENASFAYKATAIALDFTQDGAYDERINGYDKNGNIAGLNRTWKNPSSVVETMDNITYAYDGNQLTRVSEVSVGIGSNQGTTATLGFIDGNTVGDDYAYDGDGNMIEDKNKGITNITYNYLNLPTSVTLDPAGTENDGTISYVYDATGVKLQKTVNPNSTPTDKITSYAGGYIYEEDATGETLKMFSHPEGYVEPDGNGAFRYAYNYTDHLGNVRLTYADFDGNGSIDPTGIDSEIISEKNYYPFGLQHKGYNNTITSNSNSTAERFGYNGKENNPELGLEFMDFGARNYDAAIGRWMNLDPLAELMRRHSPYNYAFDNPVFYVDPDGMAPRPSSIVWSDTSGAEGEEEEPEEEPEPEIDITENSTSSSNTTNNTALGSNSGQCDDCSKCPETCTNSEGEKEESDPLQKHRDIAVTLDVWKEIFNGKTMEEVIKDVDSNSLITNSESSAGGSSNRYVIDPVTNNVIDMRHFLIVGKKGVVFGTAVEFMQLSGDSDSAFDPQDFFSNDLGYGFYDSHRRNIIGGYGPQVIGKTRASFPKGFVNSLVDFLKNRR